MWTRELTEINYCRTIQVYVRKFQFANLQEKDGVTTDYVLEDLSIIWKANVGNF